MPKTKFRYKNTRQEFTFTDAKQIARVKKESSWILLEEEEKRKYTKKVEEPESEITE